MEIEKEKTIEIISNYLYDNWDPLGLRKNNVKNQYIKYAKNIFDTHHKSPNEILIFENMQKIFERIFGRPAENWQETRKAAKEIFLILESSIQDST